MRHPLIAANWKMFGTLDGVQRYLETLIGHLQPGNPLVVVCPHYTLLPAAVMVATGSAVAIGTQSCHWEEKGALPVRLPPRCWPSWG